MQSITYTDKRGRVILSQQKEGGDQTNTYTLYDKKDRVKTILPPGVTDVSSALAYQYQYDGADNILQKYIPDMGWTEYLYDTRNLATAMQDPKLLSEGKWLCSIYDDYGRVSNLGFYNITSTSSLDGNTPVIHNLLTTTLYDGACGQTGSQYVGKVCQSRTKILNSNNWLENNLVYDDFGRIELVNGNSHVNFTVGSEQSEFTYDWADNPLVTTRNHQAFNQNQTIIDRLTYDHVGRLENTYQRVNGGVEEWLCNQDYSVKDELITKNLGGVGSNFLQEVNYSYKPNGFLTDINQTMSANDLFQLNINYETGNSALFATGQKNGNISQLSWKVKGGEKQTYGYQYDFLNRLKFATYGVDLNGNVNPNNHYNANYTYDVRGNLMTLRRDGVPNSTPGQIDNLTYDYGNTNSNRLTSITDNAPTASREHGFKPGVGGTYGYDANGNMDYDPHKDMNIRYNHLNLPEFIEFPDCKAIEYTYDAGGLKLKKTTKNGNSVISEQDYIGGIEYKNEVIEAIYNSAGRLYFENATSRYEYSLADHLGNNRVTFTDSSGVAKILEDSHFYPFGMQMEGDFTQNNQGRENKYLFNGNELQSDFGLETYDFVNRHYDSAIGRFWQIDPLASQANQVDKSPFAFAWNNPVRFNDPSGLSPDWINNGDGTYTAEAGDSALSLAEDAGISNARANSIVESQLGANYIGADGGLKSNVEVGDAVNVNTNEYTWSSGGSGVTPLLPASSSTASGGVSSSTVAGATADAAGGLGAGLTTQGGSVRLTNGAYNGNGLSPKYYASGWAGGSVAQIKTYNLGAVGRVAGNLGTGATIGIGAYDIGTNAINEGGFGIQTQRATGRLGGSLGGGAAGAYIGAHFFGIGAIPGGIIGGVIGGYGGSKAGEYVVEKIQE